MSRRALGERLREEVRAVLAEALRHRLRVQNVAVQSRLDLVLVAGQDLVQHSRRRLRTMGQMHEPLLAPHLLQSPAAAFAHRCSNIRTAEGAEAVLRPVSAYGLPGFDGTFKCAQYQQRDEVALIKHVGVRPGRQTTPIMQVARRCIVHLLQSGGDSVLHLQESCRGRSCNRCPTGTWSSTGRSLLTEAGRSDHQLGHVRPKRFPREGASEQQIRGYIPARYLSGHGRSSAQSVRRPRKRPWSWCRSR